MAEDLRGVVRQLDQEEIDRVHRLARTITEPSAVSEHEYMQRREAETHDGYFTPGAVYKYIRLETDPILGHGDGDYISMVMHAENASEPIRPAGTKVRVMDMRQEYEDVAHHFGPLPD
eukprot:12476074-Prorocentrum_lima.AAC.1